MFVSVIGIAQQPMVSRAGNMRQLVGVCVYGAHCVR